ncbi:MAG: IS66 family transposase [Janthinobacterium lividum]
MKPVTDPRDPYSPAPAGLPLLRHLHQAPEPERVPAGGFATPGLIAHVMSGDRVFADDTPLAVLDPGHGRTRTDNLWAHTRDDRSYGSCTLGR